MTIKRPCIYFLIWTLTIITTVNNAVASKQENSYYKEMEILDDLPLKNDLDKYLLALEKMLNFVNDHKSYVDLNLSFGLFLINVNLRRSVQTRGLLLPVRKRIRLEYLVRMNDKIMSFFFEMVNKHNKNIMQNQRYATGSEQQIIFLTELPWQNRLQFFNVDLLKQTKYYTRKELQGFYSKWPKYKQSVFRFDEGVTPSPKESDICLTMLAENPVNHNIHMNHCQIPYVCAQIILNGTDFGYGMTHRFLILLIAKFSRGCTIFSTVRDKQLMDKLCAIMYNEAEYIAYYDFGVPDLIMEQMALCSLEGHAQFLRRSWIDELIDFQTSAGCFNVTKPEENTVIPQFQQTPWQFIIPNQMLIGGVCHGHTTAVAGAMLASAIRYIIEQFYNNNIN